METSKILLVVAVVCFTFSALAGGSHDGEVLFNALVWLGLGLAAFAAAHF